MLAALYVLAALGEQRRPLSELTADYQRYESSGEINFTVADASSCVDAVLKHFGGRIHSIDHLDGVTVDLGDDSWFNLRSSNTEPFAAAQCGGTQPSRMWTRWSSRSVRKSRPKSAREKGGTVSATQAIDLEDAEGPARCRSGPACCGRRRTRGAQVARDRRRAHAEGELDSMRGGERPRSVIWVAGRGTAETAGGHADLDSGGPRPPAPIALVTEAPPWIGPLDVLVVAGDDPGDPAPDLRGRDRGAPGSAGCRGRRVRGVRCETARPAASPCWKPRVWVPDEFRLCRYLAAGLAVLQTVDPRLPIDVATLADQLDAETLCNSAAREVFTNPAKTLAARGVGCGRRRWQATVPRRWPWPGTGVSVLLRIAQRVVAAGGLADAVAALARGAPSSATPAMRRMPSFTTKRSMDRCPRRLRVLALTFGR